MVIETKKIIASNLMVLFVRARQTRRAENVRLHIFKGSGYHLRFFSYQCQLCLFVFFVFFSLERLERCETKQQK